MYVLISGVVLMWDLYNEREMISNYGSNWDIVSDFCLNDLTHEELVEMLSHFLMGKTDQSIVPYSDEAKISSTNKIYHMMGERPEDPKFIFIDNPHCYYILFSSLPELFNSMDNSFRDYLINFVIEEPVFYDALTTCYYNTLCEQFCRLGVYNTLNLSGSLLKKGSPLTADEQRIYSKALIDSFDWEFFTLPKHCKERTYLLGNISKINKAHPELRLSKLCGL